MTNHSPPKGNYDSNYGKHWVAKGLPTQRKPYAYQITGFSIVADVLTAAMLVDGGINATMAAAQIRNVDLRTLYQMFVHANNLCSIPADLMAKDMYEIMDTPLQRDGRAKTFRYCSGKYQATARSLIFKETCKMIADHGNDNSMRPTREALASSFLLRQIAPGGILDSGNELDLGGLEKSDEETEQVICQGHPIDDLTFEAISPLKNMNTLIERVLFFHYSFVANEYTVRPERFNLDRVLLYDREEEGSPVPQEEKTRNHTVTRGGKEFEILFNSTGAIEVSEHANEDSQRVMSLVPKEIMLRCVMNNMVMGKPKEGEAFVAQTDFIQRYVKVKTKEGGIELKSATPQKRMTAAQRKDSCIGNMTSDFEKITDLLEEAMDQDGSTKTKTLERVAAIAEAGKKRGQDEISQATPQGKTRNKSNTPESTNDDGDTQKRKATGDDEEEQKRGQDENNHDTPQKKMNEKSNEKEPETPERDTGNEGEDRVSVRGPETRRSMRSRKGHDEDTGEEKSKISEGSGRKAKKARKKR